MSFKFYERKGGALIGLQFTYQNGLKPPMIETDAAKTLSATTVAIDYTKEPRWVSMKYYQKQGQKYRGLRIYDKDNEPIID